MKKLQFKGEYITLAQTLKKFGLIDTGGEFKAIIESNDFEVNGVKEIRKGRKLRSGDILKVNDESFQMEQIDAH